MWLGITIVFLFIALVFAAYSVNCLGKSPAAEGFQSKASSVVIPTVGPPPRGLLEGEEREEGKPLASIADLPRAPNGYIAADGPTLYSDPKSGNVSAARVYGVLEDMRAFNGFELPSLSERSDPSIQMAISTFKGQFQNFLDEASTLNQNPGMKSSFTEKDIEDALANLRYLQKEHRTLENVGLVPSAHDSKEKRKEKKEGFADFQGPEGQRERATLADLREVLVKLDRELARLARSGTTDPVLNARLELFRQVRQRIDTIINDVTAGTMSALDIPILKRDVTRFLPALTSDTTGGGGRGGAASGQETLVESIRRWLSGGGSLVSDGSGSLVSLVGRAEAERIAQKILNGISIDVRYKFTSENEVNLAKAQALKAQASASPMVTTDGFSLRTNPRGEFESTILEMENSLQGGRPPSKIAGKPAKLDWRERTKAICENIRKAGLNPDDYGCMRPGAQVGPNYSWRGNAKMVCTRLEANAVAGTSQTMGCPPVEWKGWRT